jgi:hypothetical protein
VTALDAFAGELRWVAWRNETRGGKPTKVPYAADGRKAKADDPSTWGTRKAAEARASRIVNGLGGGVGLQLGDLGTDRHLCGIDLDSCIADDGALAPWAVEILAAVPTYTERSPSGRGLKMFFYTASENVGRFSAALMCGPMPGALAAACPVRTAATTGLRSKSISPAGISPSPRKYGQAPRTRWPRRTRRRSIGWRG